MKIENLIWLVWCAPGFFPVLFEKEPKGVVVDITAGTWTFCGKTVEFGQTVSGNWDKGGTPLGAYDKENPDHIRQMLEDYIGFSPKKH